MVKVVYASTFPMEQLRAFPSNFSYYITEIEQDPRFEVHLINPNDFSGNLIFKTLKMVRHLRALKPDILYLTLWQGYNNLVAAKILGLLKCKIVIWKYTRCVEGSHALSRFFFKHFYWPSINRIYMMFDNHTEDALAKGTVREDQVVTLSRGVDLKWYAPYRKAQEGRPFTLVATGKDHRDYFTLGMACEQSRTPCEIITGMHKNCLEAARRFKDSEYVHFTFTDQQFGSLYGKDAYCFVVEAVSKASAMAICCDRLPYGAGYTNIVESLAFGIPILQTLNPDVHLDPEKEGIGFSIPPYDVEAWKEKIACVKQEAVRREMGRNIQRLLEGEYDSRTTTEFIKNDFLQLVKG